MEWVEVRGRTVDVAVEAAVQELGLTSTDEVEVEVIQEPEKGFLGFGGKDAVVKVKQKAKGRRRRRSRGGRRRGGSGGGEKGGSEQQGGRGSGKGSGGRSGDRSKQDQQRGDRNGRSRGGSPQKGRGDGRRSPGGQQQRDRTPTNDSGGASVADEIDIEEQRQIVHEFLEGLVGAFGLDGAVETTVEDEIIIATVQGEETETLVGHKGSVLQSVLELTRTVVQRKSQAGARIRLDIAGYNERRREALRIYAARLADKVLEEGGEIMLEPMNPAERKVVHDALLEVDGVRTFSEGEEPNRSVVIAPE